MLTTALSPPMAVTVTSVDIVTAVLVSAGEVLGADEAGAPVAAPAAVA